MVVAALVAPLWAVPSFSAVAEEADRLEVTTDPAGGVRATARLIFPAKPEIIQAILTDYARWPELFEVRLRLADLQVKDGVAITDLRIDHVLLPGERRLVSASRTLSGGGLITDLTGGDFKRYHRVWKLTAVGDGAQTRADFELVTEIDSMVPDWLVALAMRRELDAHFRIVKEKALARAKQER
jgi:hypothetical protein